MARFTDDDAHALEPAIQFLAQLAQQATAEQLSRARPRPRLPIPPAVSSVQAPGTESLWSNLGRYDTCFLIDDSPSMADKWELVKAILDYSTELATRYDSNGIDIHFFNNIASNMDNVRDPVTARQIHHNIALRGSTPLLDQLSSHLDHYLLEYVENRRDLNFKKYNLIILTDGEPDPEDEDPGDVSDQEDARKYSGVYRLIRKKIVETARELDALKAQPNQLAIQFCQIGNEDGVQEFFEYLDDHIKVKWKLKRDVSLMNRCFAANQLTMLRWSIPSGASRGMTFNIPSSTKSCSCPSAISSITCTSPALSTVLPSRIAQVFPARQLQAILSPMTETTIGTRPCPTALPCPPT